MIRKHCGRQVITISGSWTQTSFSKQCMVCGKVFTQFKRLPRNLPMKDRT